MAMKMNEPIGSSTLGPLLIRIALGGYFIAAGWSKFDNLPGFIQQVKEFKLLPDHIAALYGTLLPYMEMAGGVLLLLGIWTTLASFLVSLLLISFIYAIGAFPSKGMLFNKDIILLAAAISLLYTGAGALSVDRFNKTG